jgi:general stress protein 26
VNNSLIEKAIEIVSCKYASCALGLIDLSGNPTVSAITVAKHDGLKWITFVTGKKSNKVQRIMKCDKASICFFSLEPLYNITLGGRIEVITDLDVKKEMWYDGCEEHWESYEDENFCVLRFTTERYNICIGEEEEEGIYGE